MRALGSPGVVVQSVVPAGPSRPTRRAGKAVKSGLPFGVGLRPGVALAVGAGGVAGPVADAAGGLVGGPVRLGLGLAVQPVRMTMRRAADRAGSPSSRPRGSAGDRLMRSGHLR